MSEPRERSRLREVLCAAAFVALAILLMVFFLRVFEPEPLVQPPPPFDGYAVDDAQEAVAPDRVLEEMEAICSKGSRFLGQPGHRRVYEHIRAAYEAAGLEIFEQEYDVCAPHTLERRILDKDGRPLEEVEVFPFMPNHMQPMVTPPEGLTGELVLLTTETLLTRPRFRDCIGLLDGRAELVSSEFGYEWNRYASLGVKALIVAHPDGLEAVEWNRVAARWNSMVGNVPVNFVRLAATKEIFQHLGETIQLRVRTEYRNVRGRNIVGVLRAERPVGEAVVIPAPYDATSILPDRAPGVFQSLFPATQLQLLKGLSRYRKSLRRDIIFAATDGHMMGNSGVSELLSVLGPNPAGTTDNRLLEAFRFASSEEDEASEDAGGAQERRQRKFEARARPIRKRMAENAERQALVEEVAKWFDQEGFLNDPEMTEGALDTMSASASDFMEKQSRYVLNTLTLELSEKTLDAKIELERDPSRGEDTPEFKAYMARKKEYDAALSASGFSIVNLLRQKREFVRKYRYRDRCRERFRELRAHHEAKHRRLEQGLRICEVFSRYNETIVVEVWLAPAKKADSPERVSFAIGDWRITPPRASVFMSLVSAARQRLGIAEEVDTPPLGDRQDVTVGPHLGNGAPRNSERMWATFAYPAFKLVNLVRLDSYDAYPYPVELPFMRDIETVRNSLKLAAETILSLAHGNGKFPPSRKVYPYTYGGRVLLSGVGQSIVPNYPLKNALVGTRSVPEGMNFSWPGHFYHSLIFTDVYGEFYLPYESGDFMGNPWYWIYRGFAPVAAGFGRDGLIAYMKDEGEEGQRLYKSVGLGRRNRQQLKNINIVCFRATGVTVMDLINPQTLKRYTGVTLINREGLTEFTRKCVFPGEDSITTFIEPDERFFVKLLSGAPDNERAQVTRAFMLGVNEGYEPEAGRNIDGEGYLAYDTPILLDIPHEVSRSMVYLNGRRMELQNRYHMTDERTREFHEKSENFLDVVEENEEISKRASILKARDSVTYSTLNHPVLRESIFEAVTGILWYLGLLVPFVFFFEKLVFGFTDIRRQLTVHAIAFLVVFGLLKLLHPAFEMIRSSLMILLGFIIILISGGMTVLFAGKFQENLESLRKRRGVVSAAQINTLGVMGVAFMLGLNNMHRRRVRTGLTCVTLILMTFVMICFTSVDTDLVETEIALGKAPYQGILYKEEKYRPVTAGAALTEKYGDRFEVCERRMMLGREWREQLSNPEISIVYEEEDTSRKVDFESILQFSAHEPLQDQVKLLTNRGWFTEAQEAQSAGALAVMIPDKMAQSLGITPGQVNEEDVHVWINGQACVVHGIFDSKAFGEVRDLDGKDLLPFDVEAMLVVQRESWRVLADDDDPRISPEKIVLTPLTNIHIQVDFVDYARPVSLVVHMPDLSYKETRKEVLAFLEQSGDAAYYGIDGIAYMGERTRERTLAGMIELIIPLIIASLTVLNTMKGSVYERQGEIFVYNAVGIAPRYVFFMFFAEAFVYAVVGSVMGYLLSQGAGRVLTSLDMTGGLNMTFTSITSIYASLAVAASVFISTYFPAKSAMEIAAPAEESGWALPEPEGGRLSFDLPFTFDERDRIAVLSFFDRYLHDHGEGSAGRFFAGPPAAGLSDRLDPMNDDGYIPQIRSTIWLKPFDLGVSQEMIISLPRDKETGEFKARIDLERLSGTRDAWLRLNYGFVALVRRHFLHWRAVSEEERREMFDEGHGLIVANVEGAPAAPGAGGGNG